MRPDKRANEGSTPGWVAAPLLLVSVIVLAAALLLWRITIGIGSWGDEAYGLSTALRFHLGDRPLVDSWDTNFSSAMMALPFVKAYLAIKGSTEGILLAFRLLFLALSGTVGFAGAWLVRRMGHPLMAVVVGALLVLYLPWLSPFIGYGADWQWHLLAGLSCALLVNVRRASSTWFILPGALSGLGAVGNPPTVTAVIVMGLALLLLARRSTDHASSAPAVWYLAGAAAVGLGFGAWLYALSGRETFAFLGQVASPDDHDFGLAAQFGRLWVNKSVLLVPALVGGAMGLAARRLPWLEARVRLGALGVSLVAVTGMLATGRLWPLVLPQTAVFIVGASVLFAELIARRTRLASEQLLLLAGALGPAVGWFVGSNGGVHSAVMASPLVLIAALSAPQRETASVPRRWSPRVEAGLAAVLVLLVAATGLLWTPEGRTSQMTERAEAGPYAGIKGTRNEVERYESMLSALESLGPASDRTVYLERFPLGYLITMEKPGTYSTWATSAESERLQEYVDLTGNTPSRIVLTRFAFTVDADGDFPAGVALEGIEDYHSVYEDENLRVLERKGSDDR